MADSPDGSQPVFDTDKCPVDEVARIPCENLLTDDRVPDPPAPIPDCASAPISVPTPPPCANQFTLNNIDWNVILLQNAQFISFTDTAIENALINLRNGDILDVSNSVIQITNNSINVSNGGNVTINNNSSLIINGGNLYISANSNVIINAPVKLTGGLIGGPGGSTAFRLCFAEGCIPVERWYTADTGHAPTVTDATIPAHTLYAVPFLSPSGGTVDKIGIHALGGLGGADVKLAVYARSSYGQTGVNNILPGNLVYESDGPLIEDDVEADLFYMEPALTFSSGELYWLVFWSDTGIDMHVLTSDQLAPVLGFASDFQTFGAAVSVDWTADALPNEFPADDPSFTIVEDELPLIGVHFQCSADPAQNNCLDPPPLTGCICLDFSGDNGSVRSEDSPAGGNTPISASPRSISAWIKPTRITSADGPMSIFSYGDPLGDESMINFCLSEGALCVAASQDNNDMLTGDPNHLNTTDWFFVTFTYDSTTATLFINSNQVAQEKHVVLKTSMIEPGRYIGSFFGESGWFDGLMMDVRLFNVCLTAEQISELYNGGCPGGTVIDNPVAGMDGWWKFNDGVGRLAADTINGKDGLLTGSVDWLDDTCACPPDQPPVNPACEMICSSLLIGDEHGYVSSPDSSGHATPQGGDARSVSVWFRVNYNAANTGPSAGVLFSYGNFSDHDMFEVSIDEDGFLTLSTSPDFEDSISGTTRISGSTWYLMTATFDGVTAALYLNDQQDGGGDLVLTTLGTTRYWGNRPRGDSIDLDVRGMTGTLIDGRLYNTCLTEEDVVKLYNGGCPDICDDTVGSLVGWWRFSDSSGTTAVDFAKGNTGTLVGNVSWTKSVPEGCECKRKPGFFTHCCPDVDPVLLFTWAGTGGCSCFSGSVHLTYSSPDFWGDDFWLAPGPFYHDPTGCPGPQLWDFLRIHCGKVFVTLPTTCHGFYVDFGVLGTACGLLDYQTTTCSCDPLIIQWTFPDSLGCCPVGGQHITFTITRIP